MAVSTRHLHHRNLAAADDPLASSGGHDRHAPTNRKTKKHNPLAKSTAVMDALSDETSHLARFLFMGKGKRPGGWFDRFRPYPARSAGPGDDDGDVAMASMGSFCGDAYCLAMLPLEIRREKVVQLAEAYAIFGGLFLGGTWVVYEWGYYGRDDSVEQTILDRIFSLVMSVAICGNIFLALWSSIFWMASIVYGSKEDFVIKARRCIAFCNLLQIITVYFTITGVFMGAAANLKPNTPEVIISTTITGIMMYFGATCLNDLEYSMSPITIYHQPIWFKGMFHPATVLTHRGRKDIREKARQEADELKYIAFRERGIVDPRRGNDSQTTQIGSLLQKAALTLGRTTYDVSMIEDRLEEDWFTEVDEMRGKRVDFLARYMPYRLAEEFHKLIETNSNVIDIEPDIYVSE